MRSGVDRFCDSCDDKAAEQWASGVPTEEIQAWYPASLTAIRENAAARRKARGFHCLVCGRPFKRKGVCPGCRAKIVESVAQRGVDKTARKYHLSPTSVREFVKEYLGD